VSASGSAAAALSASSGGRGSLQSRPMARNAAYMTAMLLRIPLHRLATAEEVASAVCWLASPQAASVTGQTVVIDGGLTAA
jgi:NAD(P)-dependent dehydrogenase (short-subunit alcohol dehydrogenase family)